MFVRQLVAPFASVIKTVGVRVFVATDQRCCQLRHACMHAYLACVVSYITQNFISFWCLQSSQHNWTQLSASHGYVTYSQASLSVLHTIHQHSWPSAQLRSCHIYTSVPLWHVTLRRYHSAAHSSTHVLHYTDSRKRWMYMRTLNISYFDLAAHIIKRRTIKSCRRGRRDVKAVNYMATGHTRTAAATWSANAECLIKRVCELLLAWRTNARRLCCIYANESWVIATKRAGF